MCVCVWGGGALHYTMNTTAIHDVTVTRTIECRWYIVFEITCTISEWAKVMYYAGHVMYYVRATVTDLHVSSNQTEHT